MFIIIITEFKTLHALFFFFFNIYLKQFYVTTTFPPPSVNGIFTDIYLFYSNLNTSVWSIFTRENIQLQFQSFFFNTFSHFILEACTFCNIFTIINKSDIDVQMLYP